MCRVFFDSCHGAEFGTGWFGLGWPHHRVPPCILQQSTLLGEAVDWRGIDSAGRAYVS